MLWLAGALLVAGYVWVYATGLAPAVIRSDGFSYYVYLPSWFLYQDTTLSAVAQDCCGGQFEEVTGILRWPGTRRWVNVHPMGVAVMQAPLFPIAHALTKWTNLPPDGFSLYYQHAAGLAAIAWVLAGLALLRRLLLDYFADPTVALTLFFLLVGTNLFHYATFDASYSHVYSFALLAAFLLLCRRWFEQPRARVSVLLGVVAGLIVLVRHANAVFVLAFALYGLSTLGARGLARQLRAHARDVGLIVASATLMVAPQVAMYYRATSTLLANPYALVNQGFHWTSPRLFDVLFSVTKGLFFWSPLLLLATAGLVRLARTRSEARAFVPAAAIVLAVHTYLIASWWDWQLGGSYGHRGFVDTLPLFAIGLASFVERSRRTRAARVAAGILVAVLVGLSWFQMHQYWNGIIPFSDVTWDQYREVFLRWR